MAVARMPHPHRAMSASSPSTRAPVRTGAWPPAARGSRRGSGNGAAARGKARAPFAPKYRNPEDGKTWTGRGKALRWLTAAEAQGVERSTFLIDQ